MEIAGTKTIEDWNELKPRLIVTSADAQVWKQAIEFYDLRMKSRYINPIEAIRSNEHANKLKGEGFAICTLICSMIEAIETFYQGKNFAVRPDEDNYEYGPRKSREVFVSFLTQRIPFNSYFNQDLADDFYSNVRCSLLHEACTRNGWKINIRENKTISKIDGFKIINRSLLVADLKVSMQKYKEYLIGDRDEFRLAFVRKFDGICQNSIIRQ